MCVIRLQRTVWKHSNWSRWDICFRHAAGRRSVCFNQTDGSTALNLPGIHTTTAQWTGRWAHRQGQGIETKLKDIRIRGCTFWEHLKLERIFGFHFFHLEFISHKGQDVQCCTFFSRCCGYCLGIWGELFLLFSLVGNLILIPGHPCRTCDYNAQRRKKEHVKNLIKSRTKLPYDSRVDHGFLPQKWVKIFSLHCS